LDITIKYRGLADAYILTACQRRHPTRPEQPAQGQALVPGQFFVAQGGPELRLAVRLAEQERVLTEVRRRVDGLTQTIGNLKFLGSLASPALDIQEELLGRVDRVIEEAESRLKARLEYSYQDAPVPSLGTSLLTRSVSLRIEWAEPGASP